MMKKVIILLLSSLIMTSCVQKPQEDIKAHVTGIELSEHTLTLCADKPDTAFLTAKIYPENADVQAVEWISGNESIVHTDSEGNIYPCGVGNTEITVKAKDGGFEDVCAVTVTAAESIADIPADTRNYDVTLYDFVMLQMTVKPVLYDTKSGKNGEINEINPPDEEVESFANPENFLTGYGKSQFLVLNEENGVDTEKLNEYLNGKGALSGKGEVFKKAAKENSISEVFLVLLACVETGNGTSEMAEGAEINSETVYNVYGIENGAKFAQEQGWTSVDKAIEGGAVWLSQNYLNNSRHIQNTIYKMRWNIETPGANQYTKNVEWAYSLAEAIGPMLGAFPQAQWRYEIPVFEEGRAVAG